MKIGPFDTEDRVLLIAEIGNNHEGDFEVAKQMVFTAVESGVDAVKFQIFQTENYISSSDIDRFALLKKFELTSDQFTELAEMSRDAGVAFVATPFDLGSAELASEIADVIKISSGDNVFYPLLEAVSSFGKPTILSTGMMSPQDLSRPYLLLRDALGPTKLALLHCVTSYPVKPEDANVGAVRTLAQSFECEVGYSDHTMGNEACLTAVACGARIIEKHFTLDHHYSDFRDHQLSANPSEMADLANRIRQVQTLLGSGDKEPSVPEREIASALRRSIVAKQDLPANHVILWDDLTWVRPAGGMPPGREGDLVGHTLRKNIRAGDRLSVEDVELD
jgi:sialic acid synthase SpsE